MGFLEKIRNKSEKTRKIIVWTITILIGLILFSWWIHYSIKKINKLSNLKERENFLKQDLNVPAFKKEVIDKIGKIKEEREKLKGSVKEEIKNLIIEEKNNNFKENNSK